MIDAALRYLKPDEPDKKPDILSAKQKLAKSLGFLEKAIKGK